MLCLSCQNQSDCLAFRLSQADAAVQSLLERLQQCDRHKPLPCSSPVAS
ncbi:MAG TPA: hypothetical protein V6D19_13785 [Stenomitos sp.]